MTMVVYIDHLAQYRTPPIASLSTLPPELIHHVLSYLDALDIQRFARTSKAMRPVTVQAADENSSLAVRAFFDTVMQRLKQRILSIQGKQPQVDPEAGATQQAKIKRYEDRVNRLERIRSVVAPTGFLSLKLIKNRIISYKKMSIAVLKDLNHEDQTSLTTIPVPRFFENVFRLAEIGLRLEIAKTMTELDLQAHELFSIGQGYLQEGEIEQAIKLARRIQDEPKQITLLQLICRDLIKAGNRDKAIEVAHMIPEDVYLRHWLLDTIEKFCKPVE